MTNEELNALAPGLYRIFWEEGEKSLAAIGMKIDGKRWIAPTNWLEPSDVGKTDWSAIERVERIDPDTVSAYCCDLDDKAEAEQVDAVTEAMQDAATFGTGFIYQSVDGQKRVGYRDYIGTGQEAAIFNDIVRPNIETTVIPIPDAAGKVINTFGFQGRMYVACEFGVYELAGDTLKRLRFVSQ